MKEQTEPVIMKIDLYTNHSNGKMHMKNNGRYSILGYCKKKYRVFCVLLTVNFDMINLLFI